jgi:hypothetical protein
MMRTSVDFISSPWGFMWVLNVDHREPTQKAFNAKPTARQIRKYKKQVRRGYAPVRGTSTNVELNQHGLPEGYEMAGKDNWVNEHYQAFIKVGWTNEQMIEQGYLRKVQP